MQISNELPTINRPYKINTTQSLSPDGKPVFGGVVQKTEVIPPELIDKVVINPEAKNLLMDEFGDLAEEQVLRSLVTLSIPVSEKEPIPENKVLAFLKKMNIFARPTVEIAKQSQQFIHVYTDYGRALPLAYGKIKLRNGNIGTIISAKGVGPSGWFYPYDAKRFQDIKEYLPPAEIIGEDPIGFFGEKDARYETDVSNALIKAGARSSMCLGYITLKPDQLKSFMKNRWDKFSPETAKWIIKKINLIEKNGDHPAILIRIGGRPERIRYGDLGDLADQEREFTKRRRAAIAIGARILHDESIISPNHFSQYHEGIPIEDVRRVLQSLSNYEVLNLKDYDILKKFILKLVGKDIRSAIQAKKDNPVLFPSVVQYCFDKDIDWAFWHYDYERYPELQFSLAEEKAAMPNIMADTVHSYFQQLEQEGFIENGFINNLDEYKDILKQEVDSI